MANFAFSQFSLLLLLFRLKDFLRKIFLQNLAQNATIKSREIRMKKEQERPKIKLKVRQTDENLTNFFDENQKGFSEQNNFGQDANKNAAQKIIIHEQNKSQNEEKTEKTQKKRSIFQICAIILTVLLAIAIIVEIFVMVALKNGATDLKNKNDKLPQAEISTSISTQI